MGNPVVHFEIGCKDKDATTKFYSQLFSWNLQDHGPAAMVDTASNGQGINGHITSLGHEPQTTR
jgi:predicted enzyme related to lactoylglutathione lyase